MKKQIIQKLSLFMILLVLSIPIAIADQTTLSVTSYAGQDNVQGFIRSFDDYLQVTAEITPDTTLIEDFSTTNVYLDIFGTENVFDSCEESDDIYTCTSTTSQTDRVGAAKNFVVTVYNDDNTKSTSEELFFYIDEEEPQIGNMQLPDYFTNEITLTIEAEDTACSTCGDVCAGIETIDLIFDDETKHTIEGDASCNYQVQLETTVNELNLNQGTQQFCAKVTDGTQNTNNKCQTITVDSQAPSIGSFVIKDDKGNAIEHMSASAILATVSVDVTEAVSGLDTIYANLSQLNYITGQNYQNMQPTCTEGEGILVCAWEIFIEVINAEGNLYSEEISVKIIATDKAGNERTFTRSLSLVEDTTAPIITNILSEYGDYLNAQNNLITVELQEENSGFDDRNIYLDFSEANLGTLQADRCEDTGTTWSCYWESLAIPSTIKHGKHIDLKPMTVKDDAGNTYEKETSIEEATFIYDKEGPEFLNVTMTALGREADVITEGDIVAILAYLKDDISGVAEVYADYSDFDASNSLTSASYCNEVESDIWECYWEYIGLLNAGEQVAVNMIAYDNAGNEKDSDDDNVLAKSRVVGTLDSVGDYWMEEVDVSPVPTLNPNFLYFTSSGTLVRFDTELISDASRIPYVHSFQYEGCQAAVNAPMDITTNVTEQSWVDAAIVGQYYYDETDRTAKYMLVQLPAFFYGQANATVEESTFIDVRCVGSISQASSVYSDIYAENEQVNLTTAVPLYTGLYAEPSITNVEKIHKAEKFLESVDKINKVLRFITEWGQKICGPMNSVRVVANNMVSMLKSVNVLTAGEATGAVAGMVEVSNFLNELWYGARDSTEYDVKETPVGDTNTVEKRFVKETGFLKNKYQYASAGYICDVVLCESCSESWNSLLKSRKDKGTDEVGEEHGMYIAGEYVPNLLDADVSFPFNPRENIVVALACNPPCVPGIYAQLSVYKEILIAYNVCLNIATMKGEHIVQCDQFLSAQICQNVVNAFFWHWFSKGLVQTLSKAAINYVFDQVIKERAACTGTFKDFAENPVQSCSAYRSIIAFTTLITTAADTFNIVKGLFEVDYDMFGNKTPEQNVDELQEQTEEDIGNQFGSTPTY
jgi:hypothetical protein